MVMRRCRSFFVSLVSTTTSNGVSFKERRVGMAGSTAAAEAGTPVELSLAVVEGLVEAGPILRMFHFVDL